MRDRNTIKGIVLESLPNLEYMVELEGGKQKRCYMAGKMRLNKIRVLIGDRVEIVDCGNVGRIVRRM